MAPPLIPGLSFEIRQATTVSSPSAASSTAKPTNTATLSRSLRPSPSGSTAPVSSIAVPFSTGTATRLPRPSGSRTASATTATASPAETSSSSRSSMTQAQTSIVIVIVVLIALALLAFVTYVVLKCLRLRYKDPKFLPGSYLKKKWTNWDVIGYNTASSGSSNANQARLNRAARSRANIEANRALDRQNSVRSVITLPPYREMAEMDLERTIGREGERDGLDTVVVYPETAEEEEDRREERMQAMYELRLQRRAQRAAREARQNGSVTSLENPTNSAVSLTAMDMEAGGSGRTTSELTAAILNDRSRRLSEVSYNEVGYARSDGSRIRSASSNRNDNGSNTHLSDSQPLLSDAASAGGRSRSGSMLSLNTSGTGQARESMDRRDSAEMLTGNGEDGQRRLPPSYDHLEWGDAPPYMSPVSPLSRNNTLERNRQSEPGQTQTGLNLPLVRVIGASNPGSPMSPTNPNRRDGPL